MRFARKVMTGAKWAAGSMFLSASFVCVALAAALAVYPGAKLDQEFERDHLRDPSGKLETKQYFTSDSFDKVVGYYKTLTPPSPNNIINTKTRRRISFGDDKYSATVEWSDEAGEDRSKTFIIINKSK